MLHVVDFRRDGTDDQVGHVFLCVEQVTEIAVEAFGPDLLTLDGIRQSDIDGKGSVCKLNVALHDIPDTELAADLARIATGLLEPERGTAGNDKKRTRPGDPRHDVMRQSAGEVSMLRVLVDRVEGEDDDRRLRRQRQVDVVSETHVAVQSFR